MSKNSNNLEKQFLEKAFRNLDRKIQCPNEECNELGNHFRCYDLMFENCDIYLRYKQGFKD